MPLADVVAAVARGGELRRQHRHVERHAGVRLLGRRVLLVHVDREPPREERAARGRAELVHVVVRQPHALRDELIRVRREEVVVVEPRVVPPLVVRHDEDQVGARVARGHRREREHEREAPHEVWRHRPRQHALQRRDLQTVATKGALQGEP